MQDIAQVLLEIVKAVRKVGGSKIVALPPAWIEDVERKTGRKLKEVRITMGDSLTISPAEPKRRRASGP